MIAAEEKRVKILAVDDEEFNLDILCEYFQEAEYDVLLAKDGVEALEMLHSNKDIDLIVLDRMMPNMDGLTFLKKVKEEEKYLNLPVIMQTAATSPSQIKEGIEAGAYYYLSKPYQKELLLSIVKAASNDSKKLHSLITKLNANDNAFNLILNATFEFYDLENVKSLAALVSNCCPKEKNVIWGLTELLLNAVEHGNLGITYEQKKTMIIDGTWHDNLEKMLQDPANKSKVAKLEYTKTDQKISITITDVGKGFEWNKYLEIDPDRITDPNGRGIALSKQISFDELVYSGCGNVVTASVYLNNSK